MQRGGAKVSTRVQALDSVAIAAGKAAGLAETAERLAARITGAISVYNSQSEAAIYSKVEDYRDRFGDEMAERTESSLRLLKSNARQDLDDAAGALSAGFDVAGQIHAYDAKADAFLPGRFTAKVEIAGAAVRFDSQTGAAISLMGGPFRSDFPRSVPDQPAPASTGTFHDLHA